MNKKHIDRREFLARSTAGAALALTGCQTHPLTARSSKRPNLLFVFSDQQSADMLGCAGNESIQTPHLDQFAAEGIRFNHCVSSFPVCTPYRAMLLSGQHPLRCGTVTNDIPLLYNNGRYIGHILQDAGYRTGYVGKWHLRGGKRERPIPPGPLRYGFDDYFYSNNCHVDYRPGKCFFWNDQGQREFFDEWEVYGQTRQALTFLDQCHQDEPFALFVSWHPPHDWGWQAGSLVRRYDSIKELMDRYDPAAIQLRPTVADTPLVRHAYHGYYAMCSGVDTAFGWLMDKLRAKGFAENTIVVFTADHGDNLSSYGFTLPKNHPEDTATRVPFLIRWPAGMTRRGVSEMLMGSLDIMPTLLGLMGLDIPSTAEGKNLADAIHAGRDDISDSVPLFYYDPVGSWYGVYTRQYTYARGTAPQFSKPANKYIRGSIPVNILYDRDSDPHQQHNLCDNPRYQAVQKKLTDLTRQWMDHFGDPGVHLKTLLGHYRQKDKSFPEDAQAPDFPGRPIDLV